MSLVPIGHVLSPALPQSLIDDPREWARIRETALRRRILYGDWAHDIAERIRQEVGHERARLWGQPELSANVALSACSSVAELYHAPPRVTGTHASRLTAALDAAGWAPMMQRVQRDTIGLREMHLRATIEHDPDTGEDRVALLPVSPDLVVQTFDPRIPTRATRVRHYVWRDDQWTVDDYDITDPARPVWRCYRAEGKEDLSPRYLSGPGGSTVPDGGLTGDAYPWRIDGRPVLPWVTYHAAITGQPYDWRTMREVFDGTLSIAVLWTYWRHILQMASWPQRYLINLDVAGSGVNDDTRYVEPDPTLILRLMQEQHMMGGAASAGSFTTSANVHEVGEALIAYERRILAYAGLSPGEVLRSSGDPRSGYALAVTRDAQRESQRRYAPIFRQADQQLMRLVAGLLGLPNLAYMVEYQLMPPSAAEQQGERDNVIELMGAGLMSRVEAYQRLNPQLSPDDVVSRLRAIDEQQEEQRADRPDPGREPAADRGDDPDDDDGNDPEPDDDERGEDRPS